MPEDERHRMSEKLVGDPAFLGEYQKCACIGAVWEATRMLDWHDASTTIELHAT